MITAFLIHSAVWSQFAIANATGMHYGSFSSFKSDAESQEPFPYWRWQEQTPDPAVEKIYLRESSLSDRLGFGVKPTPPPDELDKAMVEAVNAANHFASKIEWLADRRKAAGATPVAAIREYWDKRCMLRWDDDGGYWLGGKYYPPEPEVRDWGEEPWAARGEHW